MKRTDGNRIQNKLPNQTVSPVKILQESLDRLLCLMFHKDLVKSRYILLVRDMAVECWKRQDHGQTIHPTEKFNSIKLFKNLCVVTWAWLFLTYEVMEAVRGQKWHERVYLLKKVFIKISQQPQKPLSGPNQIWAMTSDKKDTATSSWGCCSGGCCCCNCCYCCYYH